MKIIISGSHSTNRTNTHSKQLWVQCLAQGRLSSAVELKWPLKRPQPEKKVQKHAKRPVRILLTRYCNLRAGSDLVSTCVSGQLWVRQLTLSTNMHLQWSDLTCPLYMQINITGTNGHDDFFYTKTEKTSCLTFVKFTRSPNKLKKIWHTKHLIKLIKFLFTHKTEQFYKGVWGLFPQVTKKSPILVIVCFCKIWHKYLE